MYREKSGNPVLETPPQEMVIYNLVNAETWEEELLNR
jgi:hypothetical protein